MWRSEKEIRKGKEVKKAANCSEQLKHNPKGKLWEEV